MVFLGHGNTRHQYDSNRDEEMCLSHAKMQLGHVKLLSRLKNWFSHIQIMHGDASRCSL